MEKLILANDVTDLLSAEGKSASSTSPTFSLAAIVKKGHEQCGDSAFFYCDGEHAFGGVFDGVSGESNAQLASAKAAQSVLGLLKSVKTADEETLKKVLWNANSVIKRGFTTASIFFLQKNGNYSIASVGDSPIFTISNGIAFLEVAADRPVGIGSPVFEFLQKRNVVTSVLGMKEIQIQTKSGKLDKGDLILICSDGISDNLLFKVKNEFVIDDSGTSDLSEILKDELKNKKDPKKIVEKLAKDIVLRIDHPPMLKGDLVFEPKKDDLSLLACRFL